MNDKRMQRTIDDIAAIYRNLSLDPNYSNVSDDGKLSVAIAIVMNEVENVRLDPEINIGIDFDEEWRKGNIANS